MKETKEMDARGNVLNVYAVSPALDYACRRAEPCTVSIVVRRLDGTVVGTEEMSSQSLDRLQQMELEVFKYRKFLARQRGLMKQRAVSNADDGCLHISPYPADVSRY